MQIESWPLISFILLSFILIVKIVWLKKAGIVTGKLKKNKSRTSSFIGVVFSFLLLIWLSELIRTATKINFSLLPKMLSNYLFEFQELQIAGAVLILFALILFFISLLHFGTSLRFGLDENNRGELITSGIFKRSRNPFFLSLDIYFLGIALLLPSAFFLFFALLAIVSIHFFILKEEVFMDKNYGEEYRKYRQKTRRYF